MSRTLHAFSTAPAPRCRSSRRHWRRRSTRRGCGPCASATSLISPSVSRSAWARSFSRKGQRRMRQRLAAACAPPPRSGRHGRVSGSVKVTRGTMSRFSLRRQAEQQRPDHQPGMIVGDMGELRRRRHDVADRIDAPVGGAQVARSTPMPLLSIGDAGLRRGRGRRHWRCAPPRPADACRRSRVLAVRASRHGREMPVLPRRSTRVDPGALAERRRPRRAAWSSAMAASSRSSRRAAPSPPRRP